MFDGLNIMVVGDTMLDWDVEGSVERISPEGPTMILRKESTRGRPGGAANTAMAAVNLGANTTLVGKNGADEAGALLINLLRANPRITYAWEHSRKTTTKTRIYARHQQILRVDEEERCEPLGLGTLEHTFHRQQPDAIIVSDYDKGTISSDAVKKLSELATGRGIPLVIDPKRADPEFYRGASHLTPNKNELRRLTGITQGTDTDALNGIARLVTATGCYVILKRAEKGAAFLEAGRLVKIPASCKHPVDCRGAGDVFTATLGLALAAGKREREATTLAERAAGLSTEKMGSRTVTWEDLTGREQGRTLGMLELQRLRGSWKRQGLTTGFTNGCFDLLHPGHVALLTEAAAECDRLIVAINTDSGVKKIKGEGRPILSLAERVEMVRAIRGVDAVTTFETDPTPLIEILMPDVILKGSEYQPDEVRGAALVESYGGRLVLVPHRGHSTTAVIQKTRSAV